jgi:hypothetical protein
LPSNIAADDANGGFVRRPVNSGDGSRRSILERLVFTPRSGAENDAVAAILLLRARAAKKSKVQVGLGAVIRRALREGPQLRNSSMLRNYRPSRLNGGFQRRPVRTPDPQSLDIK